MEDVVMKLVLLAAAAWILLLSLGHGRPLPAARDPVCYGYNIGC